jgi:hypothetical protein
MTGMFCSGGGSSTFLDVRGALCNRLEGVEVVVNAHDASIQRGAGRSICL